MSHNKNPTRLRVSVDPSYQTDDLWYKDGDVVFCAGKRKFRLYKGTLSAESRVFRDIITTSTNPRKAQSNSLTVITLHDDETELYYFFSAIFKPLRVENSFLFHYQRSGNIFRLYSFYTTPPSSKHDLYTTVSIMRLAEKYRVPFLTRRALLHLDSFLPLTLDDFREFSLPEAEQSRTPGAPSEPLKLLLEVLPLVSSTAHIDARWFIPRIVYTLVTQYPRESITSHPSFGVFSSDHRHITSGLSDIWTKIDTGTKNRSVPVGKSTFWDVYLIFCDFRRWNVNRSQGQVLETLC